MDKAQRRDQIIHWAKQGLGRPGIRDRVPDATEWEIRTILNQLRGVDFIELSDEEAARVGANSRKTNFAVISELRPVVVKVPKMTVKRGKKSELKTMVCISDTHGQFVDKKALSVALQIITDINPDILVHLGDLGDFYSVSSYDKNPSRRELLQDDIIHAVNILGLVDQAVSKDTRKLLVEGNHENRMQRYIWHNAPALATLPQLQMINLLQCEELGWEYVSHDLEIHPEFLIKHGNFVRAHSGYTAKAELERSWMSGISGHTHRLGVHEFTSRRNYLRDIAPSLWIENGCLCSPDAEYLSGNGNWQQGFTIIRFGPDGPIPELVHIVNGRAYHNGKLYQG